MPARKTEEVVPDPAADGQLSTAVEEAPVDVPAAEAAATIETYAVNDRWGYRALDRYGSILREVDPTWETQKDAIHAAKEGAENDGAVYVDEVPAERSRFAW
jgi:hypothetical protein